MLVIVELLQARKPAACFEIGTFDGRTALNMAANTPEQDPRYQGTAWEHKIQQLYGDSATFDYTPYQSKIDFVFIDGCHTYEYVLSDSRNAITLLRDGKGIILWHDYVTWRMAMLSAICKQPIHGLPTYATLRTRALPA